MEDVTNIKDLTKEEAIDKMKKLAEEADICMFVTNLSEVPLDARPMSTNSVDSKGNIWFFSSLRSEKNKHIASDNRVQLFYANKSHSEYLNIYGVAEIVTHKEKIKELWQPMAKAWFEEGVDDPDISLIKIKPLDAHYWDTKNNRFVALIKITVAAITGKQMDDSVEGDLKV